MFCCLVKNVGYIVDGGMVEECIVIVNYVVKVLDGFDFVVVSSIICVGVIIYKVVKVFYIKLGQWIVIYGFGGLGNLVLQYVKNVFNVKVIVIDVNDGQLELVVLMGVDLIINFCNEDVVKVIQEKIGGVYVVVVIVVVKVVFNLVVDVVCVGGCVVVVGLLLEVMSFDILCLVLDGIEVVGLLVGICQDLVEVFQFVVEGKVVLKVILCLLEDINVIFKEME